MRRSLLSFVLFAGLGAVSLLGQVVITGFQQTGSLARNDDHHSGLFKADGESLGFSINFGGATYTETFVSNNGYITFGSGSGDYSPVAFDANYLTRAIAPPIIAAFFADVDTLNTATGIVSWGTGTVNGNLAFAVKWPSVGEYSEGASPNSFEIVIVSRSDLGTGAFDVHFNYTQITWDHGGAVAGFHNGSSVSPQFYQLPGSLTSGAFLDGAANALASRTNTGASGLYLLQSRNGAFLTPPSVVPEPSTYALLAVGLGFAAFVARRRISRS